MFNIADSFYEWQRLERSSNQSGFQLKDRELFAFAGLWDKWERGNEKRFTCTMLTKDANAFMKDIHHRMPIILPKDLEDEWLKPHVFNPSEAKEWLDQIEVDPMMALTVMCEPMLIKQVIMMNNVFYTYHFIKTICRELSNKFF